MNFGAFVTILIDEGLDIGVSKAKNLYTAMGLATTVIFWGFEFGFHHLFATREMRYLGGVIGLAIGYVSKYYLDKRYVFHTEPS